MVPSEMSIGGRLELARVAARKSALDMARAVELSVRSYKRTVDGTRIARRAELLAWAELTGQDVAFFEGASSAVDEGQVLAPSGSFDKTEVA